MFGQVPDDHGLVLEHQLDPIPHPELTPIIREPTTTSLPFLQKELGANARQIYSKHGGSPAASTTRRMILMVSASQSEPCKPIKDCEGLYPLVTPLLAARL